METVVGLLLAVSAYIVGSVSPSYLLVRTATGEDVRQTRSRNAGTLNTYHRLGIAGGLTVLLLDAGKGALAVLVPGLVGAPGWTIFATAALVVIGHNWPVFLGFRGGRGAAVLLGVSFALFPVITAVCLVPIAVVMLVFRNVVLGAATGYLSICLAVILTGAEWQMVTLSVLLVVMAGATYLSNFRREITLLARDRQWRRLFLFRFVN